MVRGLSKFQEYFSEYSDSYILIGGCACDFNLELQELEFRATRDLDIVTITTGRGGKGLVSSGRKETALFRNGLIQN